MASIGDNILPANQSKSPSKLDIKRMMNVFEERSSIRKMQILAIRGDSDAEYNWNVTVNMHSNNQYWY